MENKNLPEHDETIMPETPAPEAAEDVTEPEAMEDVAAPEAMEDVAEPEATGGSMPEGEYFDDDTQEHLPDGDWGDLDGVPGGEAEAAETEQQAADNAKRKRKTIAFNILLAVCICGMVVSIVMLITIFRRYKIASNEYEGLQQSFAAPAEPEGPRYIDLDALRAINPDCIGWIEVPGTKIDYPLLQSTDNIHYLQYTFEGTWNPSGAIYLDCENTPDLSMTNSLIYGHHMKDGSMFAGLASFLKKDYLDAHKEVLVYTDEGIRHYEVFAAKQVGEADSPMRIWFGSPEEEAAFLQEMGGDKISLAAEDKILTLITCVNSYDTSDQRYIVQAVYRELEEMPEPDGAESGSNAG